MLSALFICRRFDVEDLALAFFRKRCYTISNDVKKFNGNENPGEDWSPGFSIPLYGGLNRGSLLLYIHSSSHLQM